MHSIVNTVIPIKIHLKNGHDIFEESPRVFNNQIHEEIPQVHHTYFYVLKTYRNDDTKKDQEGNPIGSRSQYQNPIWAGLSAEKQLSLSSLGR